MLFYSMMEFYGEMVKISEERVTKSVILFLISKEWDILDFDFPGSGTGRKFYTNITKNSKNKGIVIPDIIAYNKKTNNILIFESKAKDSLSDYKKILILTKDTIFLDHVKSTYNTYKINNIYFGICCGGTPHYINSVINYSVKVALSVNTESFKVKIEHDENIL